MKPTRASCSGLILAIPGLVVATLGGPAWAQSAEPAADAGVAILAGLAMLLILAMAVKMHDGKRRRDDEAMALQARLSDALLLNPALARLPIAVTVHAPTIRNRSTMVVQVTGQVPSRELREEAVRVITETLMAHSDMRAHSAVRLEDYITVDRAMLAHVA